MKLPSSKNVETPIAPTIEVSNLSVTSKELTMTSLAKSTVNCTNGIIISDIKIHRDEEGRYSLNDLHKAAGKEDKHQPAFFMRRNETIELINEILNSADMQNKNPVDSKKGRYGGTYVCKELVYSYGMWISAAFALKVIRAYDALVTGNANEAVRIAKTTVNERTPLRDAVNMLVGKKGLRYDDAYNMVHQRFNIDSIDELSLEQIPLAVEYVHRVVMEGEFIGKQEALPTPKMDIDFPVEWWNQFDYLLSEHSLQKFQSGKGGEFPARMLFGDASDAPSAINRVLFALECSGYSVGAARIELQAYRAYMKGMYYKLGRIQEISNSVLGSTITVYAEA